MQSVQCSPFSFATIGNLKLPKEEFQMSAEDAEKSGQTNGCSSDQAELLNLGSESSHVEGEISPSETLQSTNKPTPSAEISDLIDLRSANTTFEVEQKSDLGDNFDTEEFLSLEYEESNPELSNDDGGTDDLHVEPDGGECVDKQVIAQSLTATEETVMNPSSNREVNNGLPTSLQGSPNDSLVCNFGKLTITSIDTPENKNKVSECLPPSVMGDAENSMIINLSSTSSANASSIITVIGEEDFKKETRVVSDELKMEYEELKKQHRELKIENEELKKKIAEIPKDYDQTIDDLKKKNLEMTRVMDEYEMSIANVVAIQEKLKEECRVTQNHLSNSELAFSDVFQKYEKSKAMLKVFKTNEDQLKATIANYEEMLKKSEAKYETLKAHAMAQLQKSNEELEAMKKAHDADTAKQNAIIKRLEVKCNSLDESLQQKIKECEELSALCDEVLGK